MADHRSGTDWLSLAKDVLSLLALAAWASAGVAVTVHYVTLG